jgi:hypothetical protein
MGTVRGVRLFQLAPTQPPVPRPHRRAPSRARRSPSQQVTAVALHRHRELDREMDRRIQRDSGERAG